VCEGKGEGTPIHTLQGDEGLVPVLAQCRSRSLPCLELGARQSELGERKQNTPTLHTARGPTSYLQGRLRISHSVGDQHQKGNPLVGCFGETRRGGEKRSQTKQRPVVVVAEKFNTTK